jgi:hypothetical protein
MTDDTLLTLKDKQDIEAIRAKNEYYSLEDVMTYLRMRDTIAQDAQLIEHA